MGFDDLKRHSRGALFNDLPQPVRQQVRNRFEQLIARHARAGRLPNWKRAALAAAARSGVLHPLTPSRARSMLGRRGGLASASAARRRGADPLARARQVLAKRRRREPAPLVSSAGLPYDPSFHRPMEAAELSSSNATLPDARQPLSDTLIFRKHESDFVMTIPEHQDVIDPRMWPRE
jgi:hypothetical protein